MNDAHRRRMDKFDREKVFMAENTDDFPAGSPGASVTAQIEANMTQILAADAEQVSGFDDKNQAFSVKGNDRDTLIDELEIIVLAAKGIGNELPGIADKYRLPRPRTDQNLIAKATSFHTDSADDEAKFIEYGLNTDFRASLLSARQEFEASSAQADAALEEHAEATGTLDARFRDTMNLSRKRDAIVRIKYRDNPGKLAAWTVASHLERAPKKKKETEPSA